MVRLGQQHGADDVVHRHEIALLRAVLVKGEDRLVGVISRADLTVKFGPDERIGVEETIEKISQPAKPNR